MNEKIATALHAVALAIEELAEAIQQPAPVAASPSASSPLAVTPAGSPVPADLIARNLPPSFDELPPEWAEDPLAPVLAATGGEDVTPRTEEGSLASCPKHHVLYRDGKYGKYCPSTSDDPAWSNPKGFCKITPKNAAEYLRIRAAA